MSLLFSPAFFSGIGAPAPALGRDGDHYLDTAAQNLYGPKAGAWPAPVPIGGSAALDVWEHEAPFGLAGTPIPTVMGGGIQIDYSVAVNPDPSADVAFQAGGDIRIQPGSYDVLIDLAAQSILGDLVLLEFGIRGVGFLRGRWVPVPANSYGTAQLFRSIAPAVQTDYTIYAYSNAGQANIGPTVINDVGAIKIIKTA